MVGTGNPVTGAPRLSTGRGIGGRVGCCLTGVALVLSLAACDRSESYAVPRVPHDDSGALADSAQESLDVLSAAVASDDPGATARIGGSASDPPRFIVQNAHAVGVTDLQLRYVDDAKATGSAVLDQYGAAAWSADVEVSYRLSVDATQTDDDMAFVFVPKPGGLPQIAAIGGQGQRGAVWLEDPVRVRRTAGALLITATDQPTARFWRLARRAVRAVHRVLDVPPSLGSGRPLVFEVPRDQQQLEENLDVPAGTYKLIAGVTGSVDGSLGRQAPLHSFFNPGLFARLKPAGAQLVVSHEATLQDTRAPLVAMPIWIKEGFADYVALDHATVPLRTSAHNIDAVTRQQGPPVRLPTTADFDPTATDLRSLNAVYESAWLACRYIAATWGEPRLLAVYDAFDRGESQQKVFQNVLGLSARQFVKAWRRYLVRVAATEKG